MKTQITRAGRLEVATLTQIGTEDRTGTRVGAWRGEAYDGQRAEADSAEECRDLLSDTKESTDG